jgi:hypothetical protein
MPKTQEAHYATSDEIRSILGPLDTDKLLALVELRPTVAEVEEAAMWLAGVRDVFGAEPPIKGTASEIVTLLTADEEEEPPPAG